MHFLKKLDQYLLANHPILWSMRLAILLPVIALSIIVFLCLGFLFGDVNRTLGAVLDIVFFMVVTASILTSFLIFIIWIINYSKHNAINNLYPRTSISLYKEWLGMFLIIALLFAIPNAVFWGVNLRSSYSISKSEIESMSRTLAMSKMLLPSADENYVYKDYLSQVPILVKDAPVNRTTRDTKNFTYAENDPYSTDPIEYIGPSYLYASTYYDDEEYYNKMKSMLEMGKQDEIKQVMHDYIQLHKKYDLKTNLTVDEWFALVYNPPLFPVTERAVTTLSLEDNDYNSDTAQYNDRISMAQPKNTHNSAYYKLLHIRNAMESHTNSVMHDWWLYRVELYFALGLSLLLFSARLSPGRSVLLAFVVAIVSSFIHGLFCAVTVGIFNVPSLIFMFWLVYFIVLAVYLYSKIKNDEKKGKSKILVHIAIWMTPTVLPLIYVTFATIADFNDTSSLELIFDINLVACVLIIMHAISIWSRKWVALPEN